MATIGTFTPAKDGGWIGSIQTLTISAKLRLVPNDDRTDEKAPAFRVCLGQSRIGQSRIGDAWEARSGGDEPKDYLRVRIDDPSLFEPLSAALFPAEDNQSAQLVWKRRRLGT